ncbi:MAG: ATP-grasp domain-containing protein [Terriglobales bacterium]
MTEGRPLTVLCLASWEKGEAFMRECKRQGAKVLLLTVPQLKDAGWPRDAIEEIFYVEPSEHGQMKRDDVIKGVSFLHRTRHIDRIVALDDFDVETAAALREHLRVPGMGDTTARYFRDKLAMRFKAKSVGVPVPDFVPVLHYETIAKYLERVPGPWLLKPRGEASAIGIKKIERAADLWPILEQLGDRQSFYVLERFLPGEIYHVDSIVSEREVVFAVPHKYLRAPMEVSHHGGVSGTRNLPLKSDDAKALLEINRELLAGLGKVRGVAHSEFIKAKEDGRFYFMETSARVGGAHTVEVVEAATGVNLWAEWARIEINRGKTPYELPSKRYEYAGIAISLARQETPDTSAYTDAEIVWRMAKKNHVGLIVRSKSYERVEHLLAEYTRRFQQDFLAVEALPEKPWH